MPSGTIYLQNSSQTAGGGYLAGAVDWEYTQDVEANTSRVVCNLFVRKEITGSTVITPTIGTWDCSLTVDGETVSGGVYASVSGDWVLMLSKIITIHHGDDGARSVAISGAVWGPGGTGYSGRSTEGSDTLTLTTIPRASAFSCGGVTLGSTSGITITAAASGYRHDLYLQVGSVSKCLLYDVQGGTRSFTAQLSDFAAQITAAKSGTGTLKLYTYNAGRTAELGSKAQSVAVAVPASCGPSVSTGWATASYYNTGTAAANIGAWVQGYSKAQITFAAAKISTKYGASIKSYRVTCSGVTAAASPYRTQVLTGTSASVQCTVEDSRGYTASETIKVTLLPYAKPALSALTLCRSDADGTPSASGTCIYANATLSYSDLGGKNACTMQASYGPTGGAYGDAQTLSSGVGLILTAAALVTKSYTARIVAEDSLGNKATYTATIPTDAAAFHIRAGGNGAAFGKYAEQDGVLDVGWALRLRGTLNLDTMADFVQRVFGRNYESWQSVVSYPEAPGIYRTIGTDIFQNLTAAHGTYGVLVICKAGYALHLYADESGNLFWGRSGDTFGEPDAWKHLDGIVEEGTSGIWTYRKYASGLAECWGRQTCSGTASTAWGSLYCLPVSAEPYPFSFREPPVVERSVTQAGSGNSCWISCYSAESAANPGRFALVRPTSAELSAAVSIYARGKWK